MIRAYRAIGVASPPIAVVLVAIAAWITPGYDPVARTVSRLAVPGMPAAAMVDLLASRFGPTGRRLAGFGVLNLDISTFGF